MEDLLAPQVCLEVGETPLPVNNDFDFGGNSVIDELAEKKHEVEDAEAHLVKSPDQVPKDLSFEELEMKADMFLTGQLQIQHMKIHCTACNAHLGSAPTGLKNRYIHPLLRVILCKECYDFYSSGEFDKDEDGSELYCRWCGQGGKVMCCAQCSYVFCQKCIRQNLGRVKLTAVKESDDWMCFACDPNQLMRLRIICYSLYEYVQNEIRLAEKMNMPERLKLDVSLCCPMKAAKRKRSDNSCSPTRDLEVKEKPRKKFVQLRAALTKNDAVEVNNILRTQEEDEVVCTPDLSSLMENDSPKPILPAPNIQLPPYIRIRTFPKSKPNFMQYTQAPSLPMVRYRAPMLTPKPQTFLICSTNQPITSNSMALPVNNIALPINNSMSLPVNNSMSLPVNNSLHPNPQFILKPITLTNQPNNITQNNLDWFEKAAQQTALINSNLSTEIVKLSQEQKDFVSIEQLASIHNKFQELLSNSVNSLIQVRKNLRSEFLADIGKMKTKKKNDVFIINSSTPPPLQDIAKNVDPLNIDSKNTMKPRIKVKSVSELFNIPAECITIPDEPIKIVEHKEIPEEIIIEDDDPVPTPEVVAEIPVIKKEDVRVLTPVFDAATQQLIKQALLESKFDQLVQSNMNVKVEDVPKEKLQQMLSVRVVLEKDFASGTPKSNPKKYFKPMDIIEHQDIEEMLGGSILVKTSSKAQNAFGDAFSKFIAKNKETEAEDNTVFPLDENNSNHELSDIPENNENEFAYLPIESEDNKLKDGTQPEKQNPPPETPIKSNENIPETDAQNKQETIKENNSDKDLEKPADDSEKETEILDKETENLDKETENLDKQIENLDKQTENLDKQTENAETTLKNSENLSDNENSRSEKSECTENNSSKESICSGIKETEVADTNENESTKFANVVLDNLGDDAICDFKTITEQLLKSDIFTTDQITSDSGIELDGK